MRKHTIIRTSLTAIALATAALAAQAADAVHIDPKHLSQDVKVLSSDEFEGRGPNTAGETKTVNYLVEQFKAAGLQPGGDLVDGKRGWTQDVPLGRFEITGPVKVTVDEAKVAVDNIKDADLEPLIKNAETVFKFATAAASVARAAANQGKH